MGYFFPNRLPDSYDRLPIPKLTLASRVLNVSLGSIAAAR